MAIDNTTHDEALPEDKEAIGEKPPMMMLAKAYISNQTFRASGKGNSRKQCPFDHSGKSRMRAWSTDSEQEENQEERKENPEEEIEEAHCQECYAIMPHPDRWKCACGQAYCTIECIGEHYKRDHQGQNKSFKPCAHFRKGSCVFGERCHFMHTYNDDIYKYRKSKTKKKN